MMMREIWQDLRFFISRLRLLSVSESLELDEGFCVSTNNEFENWVYYPARVRDVETVRAAMNFFAGRGETFMWPVFDGGCEVLEAAGLLHAGHLEAMSLNPENAVTNRVNESVIIKPATSAKRWASCEWSAFEYGESGVSGEYFALVKALLKDTENFSLYIAELEGVDAGAFLTTNEPELMGVYYFATLPDFRRRGVASAMMKEICKLSNGKKIVLQATPSGVPFYNSFGFEDLGKIEVYSTEADIF